MSGNPISSVANELLTLNDGKVQRQIERERANLSLVLDSNMSRVSKDVEDGLSEQKLKLFEVVIKQQLTIYPQRRQKFALRLFKKQR